MQKATSQKTTGTKVTIKIGRFNEPTEEVEVSKKSTIKDVVDELDMEISSSESLWVNGEKANDDDVVEDGDYIQVVGKKEGGGEEEEATDETEDEAEDETEDEAEDETEEPKESEPVPPAAE